MGLDVSGWAWPGPCFIRDREATWRGSAVARVACLAIAVRFAVVVIIPVVIGRRLTD